MRKFIYVSVTIFILFLTGCSNDSNRYKFTYDLTMDNYTDFIEISTFTPSSNEGVKFIQIIVTIKDGDALLDDVEITYSLKHYSNFFDNNTTTSHTHTYTLNSNLTINVPRFSDQTTVKITSIKGKILTNISREIDYEKSEEIKLQLESKLTPFLDATELSIETKIALTISGQTFNESVFINIRQSPFYLSSFSNNQGIIINESNNSYILTEVGRFESLNYYRLIDQFDSIDEVDSMPDTNIGIVLSDDFFYSFEDDMYTLTGDTKTILRQLITDENTMNAFLNVYKENTLTVTIKVNDYSYTETVKLNFEGGSIMVSMTYDTSTFSEANLNNYVQMPPLNPDLIAHSTDVSQTVKDQLFVSGTTNYYRVELTAGLYAFEIDSSFDMTFYTLDGTLVQFDKSTDPLYAEHKNIYNITEGTYILAISSRADFIKLYDFRIFPLNSYKTIGDQLNPILLTEDAINVEIEGLYDYVILAIEAPEGGLLTLSPNKASNLFIYRYISDDHLDSSNLNHKEGKPIYISLTPGINKFRVSSWYVETVLFEIDLHGVTWHDGITLTDSYSDEFIVTSRNGSNDFTFKMDNDGYFVIDILLDEMLSFPRYGYSAYISKSNDLGVYRSYTSFSITETQTKIYLTKGDYALRVPTILSYKIKSSRDVPTNLTSDTLTPYDTTNLSNTLMNRDINSYDTYNWYPQNIKKLHFSLSKADYVYIDLYYPNELVLLDSLGNVINLYDPSSLLLYLEAETYTLYFKENDMHQTIKIAVQVYIVDDPLVALDDSFMDSLTTINWKEDFEFKLDYLGDSDYASFVLLNDTKVQIYSSKSVNITIFNEQEKLIRSYSSTSLTLDLTSGTYYFRVSYGVFYTPPIGTIYTFRLDKLDA